MKIAEIRGNSAGKWRRNYAESTISEYGNHSTKFYIRIRKPHFKLRKAFYKKSLERNGKNKNVLELDVAKNGGIILCKKNNIDFPFDYCRLATHDPILLQINLHTHYLHYSNYS